VFLYSIPSKIIISFKWSRLIRYLSTISACFISWISVLFHHLSYSHVTTDKQMKIAKSTHSIN